MNSQDNIQDELRGLNSDLPASQNSTPFSVPEGYFEGLAGNILAKIKAAGAESATDEIASLSPLLAGISRNMPYAVPDQYFQSNIDDLPYVVGEDASSAILTLVERVTPYQVPTGYFANFPEQVLEKVADQQPARVVPIIRRKWMKLAVAAMVSGIIAVTGYFYSLQNQGIDADKPIAQQLKNVSTTELSEFIKTADVTANNNSTAQNKPAVIAEVKSMLKGVSDKEVDAFLTQVPSDDEDLTAIN
jgi:hypothetical protein